MIEKEKRGCKVPIILKTLLPVLLALVLTAVAFYGFVLPAMSASLLQEKRVKLKDLTKNLIQLAEHYNERVISGELSEEESKARLLERIRAMRYGASLKEYFWVLDMDYQMLMHPYMRELEGQYLPDYQDSNGIKLIYNMVQTVKQSGSGYVEYSWQLWDDPETIGGKLAYVEGFKPWNWLIGTGIYYEDVRKSIGQITNKTNLVLSLFFLMIFLLSAYILLRDIKSEEKRIQTQQERIVLIKRLRETNFELEKTSRELEKANDARKLFLANVSHDLRTPLNGILGFSKLLGQSDKSERDCLFDEYVQYIQTSGKYLLNMINDFLDISRLQADTIHLSPSVFDLNELLHETVVALDFFASEKSIEICFDSPIKELMIEADRMMLSKVFYNLLSNAIKYTPNGKKVGIRLQQDDGKIVVDVWDQGIGIDEGDQLKIFEPFHQLNKIKAPGSGLGLTIAKDIVKLHSGSITLSSTQGKGTSFIVHLPEDIRRTQPETNEKGEQKEYIFAGEKILIIEDDPISMKFMTLYLKKKGLDVYPANSGSDALILSKKHNFDAILMDIQLPDINGKELFKKISRPRGNPLIIALTAYSSQEQKKDIMRAGFDDLCTKPIDTQKLLSILNKSLRAKKS